MKMLILGFILFSSEFIKADDVRFLREDRDALQARVDIIQQAKKEIFTEYFSVWNDDQSIGGMALLIEAANRGLDVKIIIDAMSHTIPKKTFSALLNLGNRGKGKLQIKVYNPLSLNILKLTHRDHAKMLVVDGRKLITGGRNVGDKYFGLSKKRNFIDLDLIANGEIANVARENFLETWSSQTVEDVSLGTYSPRNLQSSRCKNLELKHELICRAQIKKIQSSLDEEIQRILLVKENIERNNEGDLFISQSGNNWFENSYDIKNIKFMSHSTSTLVTKKTAHLNVDLIQTIASARNDVNIVSPYLIPTYNLLEAFKKLIQKGVRIRIIVSDPSNHLSRS